MVFSEVSPALYDVNVNIVEQVCACVVVRSRSLPVKQDIC